MKNSSVYKKELIPSLRGCQVHDCNRESYGLFDGGAGNVVFFFTYCVRHTKQTMNGKGFGNWKYLGTLNEYLGHTTIPMGDYVILPPEKKKIEPPVEKQRLFHMIYPSGTTKYHFVVSARDENEAKEKIIKEQRYSFDQNFPADVRETSIYPQKKEVISIYERSY